GTSTITVTVNDGAATASDTFVLTVNSGPAADPPTFLFSEDFEGTGYENTGWNEFGTPEPDYTGVVLNGTQSLRLSGGSSVNRHFTFDTAFYMFCQVRWKDNYPAGQSLFTWWTPFFGGVASSVYADFNTLQVNHGTAHANTLGFNPAADTTYNLWI